MKYTVILTLALLICACSTAKTVKEAPFTVDFNSPRIRAGTIEAQFEKIVNIAGLRTIKVNVDYFPLEDAVCLQYRLDFMTFYMYMDKQGRDAYLNALERYKEDFTNRALDTKGSKKTRRQYGNVEVYLIWQAFAYTLRAKANTFIDYGYDIKRISKNRASFFTIYRRETKFTDTNTSEQDNKIAPNEIMFFTRAQADDLAELLDQDLLKSLTPDINKRNNGLITPDIY
jgi:hypothetical protein